MSAIRQAAAIGIICLAILAVIDKRPIYFLFLVLIASGLHASAVLFLVLLPFSNKYRSIGEKIRKAIDLAVIQSKNNNIKFAYVPSSSIYSLPGGFSWTLI